MKLILGLAASMVAGAAAARAESVAREGGFEVRSVAAVAAPPGGGGAAGLGPGRGWRASPRGSGDAANMTLEPRVSGCFCERLADGGGAMHGQVIFLQPRRTLRLSALLGPLQTSGGSAVLQWSIEQVTGGSRVTVTYTVGGLANAAGRSLAPVVDRVILEQLTRLDRYVETGRPTA